MSQSKERTVSHERRGAALEASTEALISKGRGHAPGKPLGQASEPRKEGGEATSQPAAIRHPQAVTQMNSPTPQLAPISRQTESSAGYNFHHNRNRGC